MTDEEKAIDEMLDESWMDEELTGNQHKIVMNHNDEIDGEDLSMLRGMDEDMYEEENIGGNPNDELFDRLDNMTGEELVQFLKDAGQDVKNKFMSMISAGADRARNYLDKRYPENESLYEGKLSINRAIDKMDSIIDSLTETDVKKKA
jgi:flagellar motor switch protein FliG